MLYFHTQILFILSEILNNHVRTNHSLVIRSFVEYVFQMYLRTEKRKLNINLQMTVFFEYLLLI
jgi:hypothetical protein